MALLKTGYFSILPRELVIELVKYYFEYANELITLDTESQNNIIREDAEFLAERLGSPTKYQTLKAQDLVNFDIHIFTSDSSRIYVPFKVYTIALRTFLYAYIQVHKFQILTVDTLLPDVKSRGQFGRDVSNKYLAASKDSLYNDINLTNIYLKIVTIMDQYEGTIDFREGLLLVYESIPNGIPMYELNTIQEEILIYKLVKFYNDIARMTTDVNDMKDAY